MVMVMPVLVGFADDEASCPDPLAGSYRRDARVRGLLEAQGRAREYIKSHRAKLGRRKYREHK